MKIRADEYFRLDTAIKRNIDLAGLLQSLEDDPLFERMVIKSVRKKLHNLLAVLGPLKRQWDARLEKQD